MDAWEGIDKKDGKFPVIVLRQQDQQVENNTRKDSNCIWQKDLGVQIPT